MNTSIIHSTILAFILALILSGCSASTEPMPIATYHTPQSGDSYTYHEYQTELDGTMIPDTDTTLVASVGATLPTFGGVSDVSQIFKNADTTYLKVKTDSSFMQMQNEIAITASVKIPALWISYSPQTNSIILDTTVSSFISGMPAKFHTTISIDYVGRNSVVVGGVTLKTLKFSRIEVVVVTVFGTDYTTTVTVESEYAPTIGYVASNTVTFSSDSPQSPVPNGIHYSKLTNYTIH
ncbi:MAG: hypothetical protein WCH46_06145 [bacterium]